MDAASNRGIDDIRDLRDKVHFSPVEGRMKVYIVDEVHMLTPRPSTPCSRRWRSRRRTPCSCWRPPSRTRSRPPSCRAASASISAGRRSWRSWACSAGIAGQEGIEVAEASLTVIARAAGAASATPSGSSTSCPPIPAGAITLQQTLDMLGLVQQDLLFEVVDLVHERDTQGALLFVERLSQGATDYTQFIKDLLGHLRDVYVVKHTAEMPASIAMTEEQQQVLRSQAARVSTVETVAFIDLLGEALRSVRQGSDARLELELVLIKMTATHVSGPSGGAARWAETPAGSAARAAAVWTPESSSRRLGPKPRRRRNQAVRSPAEPTPMVPAEPEVPAAAAPIPEEHARR